MEKRENLVEIRGEKCISTVFHLIQSTFAAVPEKLQESQINGQMEWRKNIPDIVDDGSEVV